MLQLAEGWDTSRRESRRISRDSDAAVRPETLPPLTEDDYVKGKEEKRRELVLEFLFPLQFTVVVSNGYCCFKNVLTLTKKFVIFPNIK